MTAATATPASPLESPLDSNQESPREHAMDIPYQPASEEIWAQKYRLQTSEGEAVDLTLEDTWKRVARALADVEKGKKKQEEWYEKFLWALKNGAIPAGRIISNAGAQAYKSDTSTINCTVSGTIQDTMNDILAKNFEAGLTLKAGCGIGYEFSTLRPRGAYVSGAGAKTSGPLSFMDIFDRTCFTVSSAGGRRGAQMATFDVSHPDVLDFIRVKREAGRLRQFNLSLLVSEKFIQAVQNDDTWALVFPIKTNSPDASKLDLQDVEHVQWREWPSNDGYITNDKGQVACRVYRRVPARNIWHAIMSSTYDFAEPGFILIDKVNEMNNNWFCENVRATNPCVTGDTRLATQYGMVKIGDLFAAQAELQVTVDKRALGTTERGTDIRNAVPAFLTAEQASVYRVKTEDGYEIKATEWHDFYTDRGKIKLNQLQVGDQLWVQSGKGQFGGEGSEDLGIVLGLITGDGHFTNRGNDQEAAIITLWGEEQNLATRVSTFINSLIAESSFNLRQYSVSPVAVPERNQVFIRSVILARILSHYGFTKETKLKVPEVIWRGNEACVKGYLRALFQTDGTVNVSSKSQSCSIRLASSEETLLTDVQMLLSNFGVFSRIHRRREMGARLLPDGHGQKKSYQCRADYELIIDGESREQFMREVGFLLPKKTEKYQAWVQGKALKKKQRFATKIASIEYAGEEPVFDTTQADHNTVIFNGLVTGQCGEQPLPPYGSCLLGSVNLTQFVINPFSVDARFDWDKFRSVVSIFSRLLDNVVEVNGLPLNNQAHEIQHKRRHGMGFLGLGSTLTMMKIKYGSEDSVKFTDDVSRELALTGWRTALDLAKEKGPAPIMDEDFDVTPALLAKRPEMAADGYQVGDKVKGKILHAKYSHYMQRIAQEDPTLVDALAKVGARYTHHSSIAPTGTISLSIANNASNGIEPTFAHHYIRNVIKEGKKSKEKMDVFSFELLAYRTLVNPNAMPFSEDPAEKLPDYFIATDDVSPEQHVDIQAAAQKWVDSSISKTINVPTDIPYERFKDIYLYAYAKGLKGCTTFRFNPEAFQGVLVKEKDIENTTYRFSLADGSVIEAQGNEEILYDGEVHTAANLYDALKEGYYGKL